MKIYTDNEVVLGNSKSSKKFTIAASPKAFKILSSSLYKNKIRAIVRELTCNAVDAHRLNGNKEAFIIREPNKLNQQFTVRDFGPGLSHEDITDIYTTYFGSTKNESDDFIGGLGLGSKSPFSYTDVFSVTSYYGGKIRGYSAMMDNGEPCLRPTFVRDMSAEDKTGVEVSVPVKAEDINRWEEEIKYILRPFQEAYECGMEIDKFPDEDVFFKKTNSEGSNKLYAVYGNIVYPITDVPGLNYSWIKNGSPIFFKFEIGDLDIQPSREELSLDDPTIAKIKEVVNSYCKKRFVDDTTAMMQIKSKRQLARELDALTYDQNAYIDQEGIKFNGQTRDEILQLYKPSNKFKMLAHGLSAYRICLNPKRLKISADIRLKSNEFNLGAVVHHKVEKVYVILNDSKFGICATVRGIHEHLVQLKKDDQLKPCRPDLPAIGQTVFIVNPKVPENLQFLEMLQEHMEDDEVVVIKSSELDVLRELDPFKPVNKAQRQYISRPTQSNGKRYTLNEHGTYNKEELYLSAKEVEALEGYALLQIRDNYHTLDQSRIHMFPGQLEQLSALAGIKSFVVVRNSILPRALEKANIVDMHDVLFDNYIKEMQTTPIEEYAAKVDHRLMSNLQYEELANIKAAINGVENTRKFRLLKDIHDYAFAPHMNYDKVADVLKCRDLFSINCDKVNKRAKDRVVKLRDMFPLVMLTLETHYSINDKVLKDIIALTKHVNADTVKL